MLIAHSESLIDNFRLTPETIVMPAEVFDPASRCRLIVATPDSEPDLWRRYLRGADAVYRAHGVSAALDHDAIVDGRATTLFYVAVDESGIIRGGHRAQGPYGSVEQCHALAEWEGRPGREELTAAIRSRLSDGVIEMKSAWVDSGAENPSAISSLLARVPAPTLAITGARYLMATAAEHVLRRWSSSGGRVDAGVPASAYPDDRYRTSLMWWDRLTMEGLAEPAVRHQIRMDTDRWLAASSGAKRQSVA